MENIKKIIEWTWMSALVAAFVYWLGSFIAMNLNVTEWPTEGRAIVTLVWTVVSVAIAASLVDEH